MQEIIKITETAGQKAVSGKDLHAILEVKTGFVLWMERMCEYGFEENKDYVTFKSENPVNKQVVISDYIISIDMAKEIAMIQRSEIGRKVRQYFIEVEKMALAPKSLKDALYLAYKQAEQIEQQAKAIEEMKPKAEFFDAVTDSKDTIDIGDLAKVLDLGYGRNKLFQVLRDKGVLMKGTIPRQTYIDNGWFKLIETKFETSTGVHVHLKPLVFQKGVDGVRRLLSK